MEKVRKPKADFDYQMDVIKDYNVLAIQDLDLGNMSVTNDMEQVVAYIEHLEKIDTDNFLIVYQDSTGQWDGWSKNTSFFALRKNNFYDAVVAYIALPIKKCEPIKK